MPEIVADFCSLVRATYKKATFGAVDLAAGGGIFGAIERGPERNDILLGGDQEDVFEFEALDAVHGCEADAFF